MPFVQLNRRGAALGTERAFLAYSHAINASGSPGVQNDLIVIMVVEDDQLIQGVLEEALSEGGFETAIATVGEEAITLLQDKQARYRALITDINLPGRLDGWEVARRARQLNPEIPVIYITGPAADEWASQGVPKSILLSKPFAPAQIVTAVAQLLNESPPSAPDG
jgi:CheY-like chemotaxis protein